MNRENLQKLATFLAYGDLPKEVKFDMEHYADDEHLRGDATDCGTAGCAIGFAVFAGMVKHPDEDWTEFSQRISGLGIFDAAWDWCFGANWKDADNTPLGAAKRIQYLLGQGVVPDEYESGSGMEDEFVNEYADVEVKR